MSITLLKSAVCVDIKPDNFLIGMPNTKLANVVHMVDFGMAKACAFAASNLLFIPTMHEGVSRPPDTRAHPLPREEVA